MTSSGEHPPASATDKIRVLVFPCGSEPGLEIHQALRYNVNVEVHGASSRDDHGRFLFRHYQGGLPYLSEPSFLPSFNALLRDRAISLVIPTHDTVALYLAEHRAELAAIPCVSDAETMRLCRDKLAMYARFADEDFCPRLHDAERLADDAFPVFLKPAVSEGGKGAHLVRDRAELAHWLPRTPSPVLSEYLPGEELTVDCFTDRHGEVRFVGPRVRSRVWAGISVRSTSVEVTPELASIAARINGRLRLRGLWYFQVKADDAGRWKLLEVSARCAGTMSVHRARGVNLPLLTVYDALDRDVVVAPNAFQLTVDRALVNRYDDLPEPTTLFLDLDDTLIVEGRVNTAVMTLLYQCRAKGVRAVLVTRHAGVVSSTLDEHRIHPGLFDEVLHLRGGESKADHMADPARTWFVDNAFTERKAALARGAAVFDVDAVPALLDWRLP